MTREEKLISRLKQKGKTIKKLSLELKLLKKDGFIAIEDGYKNKIEEMESYILELERENNDIKELNEKLNEELDNNAWDVLNTIKDK